MLDGRTVAIYPSEISAAWAYGLKWDPLPIWPSYAAYSTALDGVNARFLISVHAPQRILMYSGGSIDGRILSFDQPEANREMLCRYLQLYVTPRSAVLGSAPNRCGTARLLRTVHADWDQQVVVPVPPDSHSLVVRPPDPLRTEIVLAPTAILNGAE